MTAYLIPVDEGRPIALDKAIVLFGRHSDCDVVLTHSRKISRKHCCVAQVNNRLIVRDLGSLNGVWVNGSRVERETTLRLGDEVAIGDVRYSVADHNTLDKQPVQRPARSSGRPATSRPRDSRPANISLDVPVAIPEPGEGSVERSLKETPDAMPVVEQILDGVPVAEAVSDDVLPSLEDSAEEEEAEVQLADSRDM